MCMLLRLMKCVSSCCFGLMPSMLNCKMLMLCERRLLAPGTGGGEGLLGFGGGD